MSTKRDWVEGTLDSGGAVFTTKTGEEYDLYPFIDTTYINQLDTIRRIATEYIDDGLTPLVYTSPAIWKGIEDHKKEVDKLKPGIGNDTMLCIAHWGVSIPSVPADWEGWMFWEYASDHRCYFHGDDEELAGLFDLLPAEDSIEQEEESTVEVAGKEINLNLSGDLDVHVYVHRDVEE